jgi:hypothetical protein
MREIDAAEVGPVPNGVDRRSVFVCVFRILVRERGVVLAGGVRILVHFDRRALPKRSSQWRKTYWLRQARTKVIQMQPVRLHRHASR